MDAREKSLILCCVIYVGACTPATGQAAEPRIIPAGTRPEDNAAQTACTAHNVDATDPNRYRAVGDHCEGVYIEPVAGNELIAVSVTASVGQADLKAREPLVLEWNTDDAGPFDLDVRTLGSLHWSYDAARTKSPYSMPTSVFSNVRIDASDLGILVRSSRRVGQTVRKVDIPATVRQGTKTGAQNLKLVVFPGTELESMSFTLDELTSDGSVKRKIVDSRAVGTSVYPARTPVAISLVDLADAPSGIYVVEVTATTADDVAVASLDEWIDIKRSP